MVLLNVLVILVSDYLMMMLAAGISMNVQQIMEDATTNVIIQKEISTVLANMDINLITMVTHAFMVEVHHRTSHHIPVRAHHSPVNRQHSLLRNLPTLLDMDLLRMLQWEHLIKPTNQDITTWVESETFLFFAANLISHYCWLIISCSILLHYTSMLFKMKSFSTTEICIICMPTLI